MTLIYMMLLQAIAIWACFAADVEGQLITSDQKNVIEAHIDQGFQFSKNTVQEDECQCGQSQRNADEWMASCRLCLDASLASTLFIKVAVDAKAVASWTTSDNQGCIFSEYGKTRFTTISCNKTLQNNLLYVNFRLKPTDQNVMYDQVPWMCGAEAMVSSNKKAYFSKWCEGEICYREINGTDHSMPSVDSTAVTVTSNGEFATINTANQNTANKNTANQSLEDTYAGTLGGKNEAFLRITYRQIEIFGMVFVAALLLICISGSVVIIKRRHCSTGKKILREESKEPIVVDSYSHEVKESSEYAKLNYEDTYCGSYAVPSNEHLTESKDSSSTSHLVAATEVNSGNSQIYQHLLYSHYCHVDDYERINADNACYA